MSTFSSLGGSLSESDFEKAVENGDFIEVSPGNFQSREAATWPLAALADSNAKGRAKPDSNVSGAFVWTGSGGEDGQNRFRDLLSNPKRHD